jgi:hypothetical protein
MEIRVSISQRRYCRTSKRDISIWGAGKIFVLQDRKEKGNKKPLAFTPREFYGRGIIF